MKNFLISIVLSLISIASFACHESYTTLVSGPTAIGGGQYSTTVQFCIGQTVNWGGTFDFTVTLNGANFVSYSPTTLSNTYGAWTTATCNGPNCFMGTCASITANAGSSQAGNTVTYTTTSSTPANYPLVPDDVEQCGGNPTSYCFNFTFVSDAYPTSIVLAGNVEMYRPRVCNLICGHSNTYVGGPCNGTYDPAMTLTFAVLPIELEDFDGYNADNINHIYWVTATEINNDYFTLERSVDGENWIKVEQIDGSGNSNVEVSYEYIDDSYPNKINYYRLSQTDFDGAYEEFNIIAIDNTKKGGVDIVKIINAVGQEVDDSYKGLRIIMYSDGTREKKNR